MANFGELKVRRRLMEAFITRSAEGDSGRTELKIRLVRDTYGKTASGGRAVISSQNIREQVFALMPFKRRQTDEGDFTAPSSGRDEVSKAEFLLIVPVDADVDKGDWFHWTSEEHLRSGLYKVEYVAARHHDRKLVGIYYHDPGS